ncbi:MAG: acylphosphatase [Verrucomicrobiota bacterium]
MFAKRVYYEGRVQGVGFRYTTKQIAKGYDVQGWVHNLPDGRVEMVAVADEEEELDDFLLGIREGMQGSNIKGEEIIDIDPVPVKGFEIR